MKTISINEVLDYGLHDASIEKICIDFQNLNICIYILASGNLFKFDCINVKRISGLSFDNKNKPIILTYDITFTKIKMFTTFSEYLEVDFDEMIIYELNSIDKGKKHC